MLLLEKQISAYLFWLDYSVHEGATFQVLTRTETHCNEVLLGHGLEDLVAGTLPTQFMNLIVIAIH